LCFEDNQAELGSGAYGTVRCAFHQVLDIVAVKCFAVAGGDNQKELIAKK